MIHFNELRITPDRKYLIIDAEVNNDSYYNDVTIKSVYVDTQKTWTLGGPSQRAIFQYEYEGDKQIHEIIDLDSLNDNLFFVYVVTEGKPAEDTPCGQRNPIACNVVYDEYIWYDKGMNFISNFNCCDNSCELNRGFIDYILKKEALDLSIKNGDYQSAINLWKKFNLGQYTDYQTKRCGCHG